MTATRGPGTRAGLTAPAVLAAARELLAEGGVEAVTMRALARRLGVAPNALYSHVRSKTALLDDVLDDVLGSVEAPPADGDDPVQALVDLMSSTHDVLTAHRDLVPLYLARQGARGPQAVRLGALMDELLSRAGVPCTDAGEARRVLILHTIGSAAFTAGADEDASVEDALPLTAEDARRTFGRSLRWLLVGIVGGGTPDEATSSGATPTRHT